MLSLNRRRQQDVEELLSHEFRGIAASIVCRAVSTPSATATAVVEFCICVYQGPYRGGHFIFKVQVSDVYPFQAPEVFSCHPIWHPNVDLQSGTTRTGVVWSPVMNLVSAVEAVGAILLEPHVDYNINPSAAKLYIENRQLFDVETQMTLQGGVFRNVYFPPCRGGCYFCSTGDCLHASRQHKKRQRTRSRDDDERSEGNMELEGGQIKNVAILSDRDVTSDVNINTSCTVHRKKAVKYS